MAVYQCTLTKTVKGTRHFIYPKSISTNIKHNTSTVYATLVSHASSISALQTKTTNISFASDTTTISGTLSAGGVSVQNATVNAGEFIDVKRDASGYLLEYTDTDGNKYFTGDVHAPNIDGMLGSLQSYLTVSLSKTTVSLNTRMTTLETNYTKMISRFATDEANITTNTNNIATNTTNITTLNTNYTSLATRVTTAETNINTNKNNIATLNTNYTSLASRVTTAETNINTNKNNITTLNANASTAGSVDYKIAALETKYGYSSTTSTEYVQVVRDSDGKIAYAVFTDGSVLINDLESPTIDALKKRLDTIELKLGLKKTLAG